MIFPRRGSDCPPSRLPVCPATGGGGGGESRPAASLWCPPRRYVDRCWPQSVMTAPSESGNEGEVGQLEGNQDEIAHGSVEGMIEILDFDVWTCGYTICRDIPLTLARACIIFVVCTAYTTL